ncbi:hypothetical protein B296_00048109, partial [Ensete ventricosum]
AKVEEDLSAEELFRKKKIRLAEIGLKLLENPEENIKALKEFYRIRLPTEKEMEMTVSKAVRQQRFYESTLLRSYKAYLMKLIILEKQLYIRQVAVRCLCSLLDAVPHFNFRESILASVVKNISSSDDTIRSIFSNEGKHGGEATLEAVRLIADHVKFHDCQLHPDSIDVSADLKAVSFAPDSKDRKMMQSEALSAVFETYFRILKHSMDPSASR